MIPQPLGTRLEAKACLENATTSGGTKVLLPSLK